jgi:hypothetical protein
LSPSAQPPPEAARRPHRARATQGAAAETAPDGATEPAGETPPTGETASDPAAAADGPSGLATRTGKPRAEIAHATRGRVRIKVPPAKSNPELLHQIRARFEGHPGIEAIDVKQSTGSVIIYYDPEHHEDIPSLFASLDKAGATPTAHMAPLSAAAPGHHGPANKLAEEINAIEEEAEFLAEHSHFARSIVEYVKGLDRQIKRSTNNNIDLKILAPVGLAAFTFLEIGAAAATPMWVTLVIFSLNHFVELHAHDADQSQS